jgi:non-receptor tyrosine kinase TNP-like protein
LTKNNALVIFENLNSATSYLRNLKMTDNTKLVESNRKIGFLGFIIGAKSIELLYKKYIDCSTPLLNYLFTYKLSQDHLEMFFSAIRSRGGYNNNPSARQFETAYKRLLVHAEIKSSTSANVMALDDTPILQVSSPPSISVTNTGENLADCPEYSISYTTI